MSTVADKTFCTSLLAAVISLELSFVVLISELVFEVKVVFAGEVSDTVIGVIPIGAVSFSDSILILSGEEIPVSFFLISSSASSVVESLEVTFILDRTPCGI